MIYSGIRCNKSEFTLKIDKSRHQNNLFDKWIDEAFIEVFGIPVRNQCCFCVKNPKIASNYGTVYTIEPVGNFRAFYSNEIIDLHDLSWVKSQIYSDKEFTYEMSAAFAIRVWTSEKCDNKELKWNIARFFELKQSEVLKYALSLKNTGKEFVSAFYKETKDFSEVRKNVEIMVVCDAIKCIKLWCF